MKKFKKYTKLIVFDGLALLCFIGVALFGWLPGPGGVPLLIAGLSLLAVNHDWAERWLETTKHKGMSLKKQLFPDKPLIRHTYDVISVIAVTGGLFITFNTDRRIISSLGVGLVTFGLGLFLFNRERLDKLADLVKRRKA